MTTSPAPLDPKTPVQLVRAELSVVSDAQPFEDNTDASLARVHTSRGDYTLKNPTAAPLKVEFVVPAVPPVPPTPALPA